MITKVRRTQYKKLVETHYSNIQIFTHEKMDEQFNEEVQDFLQLNIDQMSQSMIDICTGKSKLNLPFPDEIFLIKIASHGMKIFENEPSLLDLKPPIIIVGDLHGQLLNLFQIFQNFDLPPNTTYLFLGDIVDRGPFSIETVTLLFSLKICFPENVYIIRGNHEFSNVSLNGGFFEELTGIYNNQEVFNAFNEAFNYLPIAAKLGPYICLHGGISPELETLEQIRSIPKPITGYSDPILCGIFWSDPHESVKTFQSSTRGVGFFFGRKPLISFLNQNNLKVLIRGHECVDGYSYRFKNRCVTVFSASNYCGTSENHAAALQILSDYSLVPFKLPYIKFLKRTMATFIKHEPHHQIVNSNQIISNTMDVDELKSALKHSRSHVKFYRRLPHTITKRRRVLMDRNSNPMKTSHSLDSFVRQSLTKPITGATSQL